MSSSLEELDLKVEDLRNLNTDEIQEIFRNLTVKEISKLCVLSKAFNTVCKREKLWEEKVAYEYQPEEPLSHKRYMELVAGITKTKEEVDRAHVDCDTGACPIDFKEKS